MIKAGLLGWLRFLPLGEVSLPEWGALCAAAGLAAAAYGAVVGLTQDEPKTLLAYSSVSQMGLMLTGIGIGLSAAEAWPAALSAVLLSALHHGLAKGALFLGVGVSPGDSIVRRWIHAGGLVVPAIALAGAPFTSGAVAKVALKNALADSTVGWPGGMERLLGFLALGTALLMGRFIFLIWTRGKTGAAEPADGLRVPWLTAVVVSSSAVWVVPLELFHEARGATLAPAHDQGLALACCGGRRCRLPSLATEERTRSCSCAENTLGRYPGAFFPSWGHVTGRSGS